MSGPLDDVSAMLDGLCKSLRDASKFAKGSQTTVIVHPQISRTHEEAALLASDWRAKEERQLMDNLAATLRG